MIATTLALRYAIDSGCQFRNQGSRPRIGGGSNFIESGEERIHAHSAQTPSLRFSDDAAFIHHGAKWSFIECEKCNAIDPFPQPDLGTTRVMATRALRTRNLAEKYQLLLRPPGNSGNSHILPVEEGLVVPGDFVFSVDTHSGNLGAVGAVAPCVLYEMSCVFATGTLWLKVPETVRVHLSGRAQRSRWHKRLDRPTAFRRSQNFLSPSQFQIGSCTRQAPLTADTTVRRLIGESSGQQQYFGVRSKR